MKRYGSLARPAGHMCAKVCGGIECVGHEGLTHPGRKLGNKDVDGSGSSAVAGPHGPQSRIAKAASSWLIVETGLPKHNPVSSCLTVLEALRILGDLRMP